ncbi:hypothetical protein [Fictibacillus sp. NRS-1165]|uniref:hypothetical protein n=1 Tax=Fictibacillus sp. NRS-1165 TaxID=3144463 RepID=UPI003D1A2AF9
MGDKLVLWYDWENQKKKWEVCDSDEHYQEIIEEAKKECESYYQVMVFDMDDVLNRGKDDL